MLTYTRGMDNSKRFHCEVFQPERGDFTEVSYYGITTGVIGTLRIDESGVDFCPADKLIPLDELAAVVEDCKEKATKYVFESYGDAVTRNPSEAERKNEY